MIFVSKLTFYKNFSDFIAAGFMCVGLIFFTLADSQVKKKK
jgi:hypothetical protein